MFARLIGQCQFYMFTVKIAKSTAQPDTDNHSFLLLCFQQPSAGAEKLYVPVCTQGHYLATLSYRVESLQHL